MTETAQSNEARFWLLSGDVPSGPFTVAQVHAKLATGEVSWQTLACPVGGGTWLPLVKVPGIGPVSPPTAATPNPASDEMAGRALTSVAVTTAIQGGPQKGQDQAAQDGKQTASMIPFRFRSGGQARSLDEFVVLCEADPEDAEWHLMNGDLEHWFRESGQGSLATKTQKARTSGWMARQALIYILKQCGEPGRALASRIEADEVTRRQKAEAEARRHAEGNGEQDKHGLTEGCPKCGLTDRWRDGRCYHCGYSTGTTALNVSSPSQLLDCVCGKQLEISPEQAGMSVQCPFCKRVVVTPVGTARLAPETPSGLTPEVRTVLGIVGAIGGGIAGAFITVSDSAGNSSSAGLFGILLGAAIGACWAASGFKLPTQWGK